MYFLRLPSRSIFTPESNSGVTVDELRNLLGTLFVHIVGAQMPEVERSPAALGLHAEQGWSYGH